MPLKYEEDIKRANEELKEEVERSEKIVCERYQPIFDIVAEKVQKLMQAYGIIKMRLSPTQPSNICFTREGKFEYSIEGPEMDLQTVAKAYQIEHRRTQNPPSPPIIRIQDALKMALDDLVKKSEEAYHERF